MCIGSCSTCPSGASPASCRPGAYGRASFRRPCGCLPLSFCLPPSIAGRSSSSAAQLHDASRQKTLVPLRCLHAARKGVRLQLPCRFDELHAALASFGFVDRHGSLPFHPAAHRLRDFLRCWIKSRSRRPRQTGRTRRRCRRCRCC